MRDTTKQERRVLRVRDQPPTTIAILGGNTVVGHALALLLAGVGYETKALEALPTGLAKDLLGGADLLLVSPGLSDERRVESLAILGGVEGKIRIPVIELTSAVQEELFADRTELVPWPTSIQALAREIEAALQAANVETEIDLGNLQDPPNRAATAS